MQAQASKKSRTPWRARRALACALAVAVVVLLWLASWLLERRAVVRARMDLEHLGPRIGVEEGPRWLSWLGDKRYFERVVEVNLSDVHRFDRSWLFAFKDVERVTLFNAWLREDDLIGLSSLHRLRELNLVRAQVADPDPRALAEPDLRHLAEIATLEELRVGPIKDDAITYLSGCQELQVLRILLSPEFTDRGLASLSKLPKLKTVYLLDTSTTEAGLEELRRRLPSLEIVQN